MAQAKGRRLQAVARAVPVEGETERLSARLHPREMPLEALNPLDRIEGHRFDEVEAFPRCAHKFPLGQTFAPFLGRLAVGDDPGTEPQRGVSGPILARKSTSLNSSN